MTNGAATPRNRATGAKMIIRVYTVSSDGVKSEPRATVSVLHGHKPVPTPMSSALPPCACPIHRQAGAGR
ncbi:hypothetical protein [Streptomyces thermodiastaticus]|jgi:hypothetical protein|uniref:hypothetical protein n=1 Tax=Streptomyces thermodiastaticus TaxID=44061 RepID=UPI001673CC29|nr:hypothetical protein [Streptomyces thermodiastaticus]MCE7553422.1 hypothetical protein [Streptomyces thermodiastaticus]GHF96868.1 hypothetical protein GCM10018787_51840 [Streptomyces thermodiastaticus]